MYHYVYKVISKNSGRYYIGRHSTNNLKDNYMGSGKWIRSVKDKSNLYVEILEFHENFDSLKIAEKSKIIECIKDPLNMNFNNNSVGFAYGDLNPSKSEKERKRRSEQNWTKTPEGRSYLSLNNPSKKDTVKVKRKIKAKEQLELGIHNFQNIELREKVKQKFKDMLKTNNPMHRDDVKNKISAALKGKPQVKVNCPVCGKEGGITNMKRYHFNNCTFNS